MNTNILEIETVSVSYGTNWVLDRLSLKVNSGKIMAVIGPNGAGKTTLIRALSGSLLKVNGAMRVNGRDLHTMSASQRARYLAVVPQARNLPADYTVYQTVLLGRTPYLGWLGHTRQIDHQITQKALVRTNCETLSDRLVGDLSGGEQQRVLLARALAQDTPILLLDEPTTHLDLQHQSSLLNLVRKLADEQGLAVMIVLHDLNLASLYADQIALLSDGRIFAQGKPSDVLTEENLNQVFHVPVHVIPHPDYGSPLVLPDGKF